MNKLRVVSILVTLISPSLCCFTIHKWFLYLITHQRNKMHNWRQVMNILFLAATMRRITDLRIQNETLFIKLRYFFLSPYFNHKNVVLLFQGRTCVWTAKRLVICVTDPSSCYQQIKIKEGKRRQEEVDCLISGGMSELVELLLTHVQNVAPTFLLKPSWRSYDKNSSSPVCPSL